MWMCCIVKHLIFGACVELHPLFDVFRMPYFEMPLIFGACVEMYHCLVFSICCISKYLLYLALVLNYVFVCQCGCGALQNTSYIWRLCRATSLFVNVDMLHCKTRLIFGACVELHALFDAFLEQHFELPLIFDACVELRFPFSNFDVLHFRAPLIFGDCVSLSL